MISTLDIQTSSLFSSSPRA